MTSLVKGYRFMIEPENDGTVWVEVTKDGKHVLDANFTASEALYVARRLLEALEHVDHLVASRIDRYLKERP